MGTSSRDQAILVILMGVSGSGKSTVGRALAARLGWPFVDGDDLHPPANVEKMRRGQPLTDADRAPWLDSLQELIAQHVEEGQPLVLACSALKESYRKRLQVPGVDTRFVYLRGNFELIQERMQARTGHYMPSDLLQSQFDALEEPAGAITIDIAASPAAIVEEILRAIS